MIRLRSGDGRVGVAITAARREVAGPARLRTDLERAIRASRRGVRVEARSRTPLGDASALVTELSAPGQGGRRDEILVMAAQSRWRVYGVTVFSRRDHPTSTMPDLAAVLDSFEYRTPS